MRFVHALITFTLVSAGFADTLTLRNGRTVDGTYLGGTAREIRMEVGDRIQTYDVGEVASVNFANPKAARALEPAPLAPPPPTRGQGTVFRPDPTPAPAEPVGRIEIPAGTNFVVRMIDAVDSERSSVGQTFNASMDEPVMVNGEQVIPRGTDVVVKLVDDKQSGKLTGKTVLTLDLQSVRVNGRMVDINTQSVSQASGSRGARTAKMATGGAALGAIIGAIAGGGKGAAVGAGAGAAAGTGAEILTKGQRVHIPSETRLTFVLDTSVRI
jgi:hypothetical protein